MDSDYSGPADYGVARHARHQSRPHLARRIFDAQIYHRSHRRTAGFFPDVSFRGERWGVAAALSDILLSVGRAGGLVALYGPLFLADIRAAHGRFCVSP